MDVRSTPEALRHRARLLVGTVALIVALSLVLGLTALAEGTPAVAAARLVFGALAVPLAFAGWRDPSADWPHHLLLCTGAVDFLLVAHLTPGMDVVSLYWAALIPLLATMTFDLRRGGAYAVATALGTVLVLVAGADPSAPHLLSAPPATRDTVRIVSFTLVVGACVYLFELDRRRALAASRRALAEAHAERATKARFFSAMSHELRTPLNGVLGLIQVLLADTDDAEERRVLALAERSCEALGALIGDVVDESAHRSAGGPPIARREERATSLRALAEDVAALSRASAERKGLALLLEVSPTVPAWVRADEVRVRQLLHNLIGNALKFTDHGHVRVVLGLTPPASEGAASQLQVTVEDTGIGVPSEALATIFEPFRQADASTSRRFGGSGLGLAISRRTVEQLGGTLTVSSSPGVGTRFDLTLPVVEVEPPVAVGPGAPAPALARRVLCVDDNAVNLRVLELMLTRAGAQVVTARSGHEATRVALASDFDAILMDRHMPDGDGLEATRAIRAHGGPRGRVPIIAVTAAALPAELEACLESGMDEALTKPVSRAALLAALERVCAQPRAASTPSTTEAAPGAADTAPPHAAAPREGTPSETPVIAPPRPPLLVRLVDALLPERLRVDPRERAPGRVLVVLALGAIGLNVGIVAFAWASSDPAVTADTTLLAVVGVGTVGAVHLFAPPQRVYFMAILLTLVVGGVELGTSERVTIAQLLWATLMPLTATLLLGHRYTVRATLATLGLFVLVFMYRTLADPARPLPPTPDAVFVLSYMLAMGGTAAFFDYSRGQGLAEAELARRAALDAAGARSRFLAHMTHELRTPMGGVVGLLEVLAHDTSDATRRAHLLAAAHAGRQLLELVDDILDHARIEHGGLVLERLESSPATVARTLTDRARRRAEPEGLRVRAVEPHTTSPSWRLDLPRLGRIVEKLVDDLAVARGARAITLELREAVGAELRLTLTLSAEGCAEPRPGALATREGAGLGLALARALVGAMGGELSFDVGRGWVVSLPVERGAAVDEPAEDSPPVTPTASTRLPLRAPAGPVLVVDDNIVNRAVASRLVRRLGLIAIEAEDGFAALAQVEAGHPSVVLLDHEMPGLDGLECLRRLRAEPRHHALPVVLLTASTEAELAQSARDAGADAVLVKPVTIAELQRVLGNHGVVS